MNVFQMKSITAAALCLTLVACGGGSTGDSSGSTGEGSGLMGDSGGSTGDAGGSTGDGGGSTGDTGGSKGDAGGSTGDGGGAVTGTQVGRFVNGQIANLGYTTATHSGYTNASGEFEYEAGEVVSFHVGDIAIGSAVGATELTPFDLVGLSVPRTSLEINHLVKAQLGRDYYYKQGQPKTLYQVSNISAFLQTLDEDGNNTNGIIIPDAIHALADGIDIDFTQRMRGFKRDFSLQTLLTRGRDAGLWGGTRG